MTSGGSFRWPVALSWTPVAIRCTWCRTLAGSEPTVVKASAKLHSAGVDRRMEAEFTFADGRTGGILASMWSSTLLRMRVVVTGTQATMSVFNPTTPHMFNRLSISGTQGEAS